MTWINATFVHDKMVDKTAEVLNSNKPNLQTTLYYTLYNIVSSTLDVNVYIHIGK